MKSLPKRRNGNKGRQEREGEKLFGLGNLFRSKIKISFLKIPLKRKNNFLFSRSQHRFYSANQKKYPTVNPVTILL